MEYRPVIFVTCLSTTWPRVNQHRENSSVKESRIPTSQLHRPDHKILSSVIRAVDTTNTHRAPRISSQDSDGEMARFSAPDEASAKRSLILSEKLRALRKSVDLRLPYNSCKISSDMNKELGVIALEQFLKSYNFSMRS